jgi:hypothetical protein
MYVVHRPVPGGAIVLSQIGELRPGGATLAQSSEGLFEGRPVWLVADSSGKS